MLRKMIFCLLSVCFLQNAAGKTTISPAVIKHHQIQVTLNPERSSIDGIDEITIQLPDGKSEFVFFINKQIDKIKMDDSRNFILTQISYEKYCQFSGEKPELGHEKLYSTFHLKFLHPEETVTAKFIFSGMIYDSLKEQKQDYARGFATTSGLIDTRGIFLAGSSAWIPAQSEGNFTYRLRTMLPLGWHSVSQGEEVERRVEGDFQINEWNCGHPMEEIYLIGGKYLITEEDHLGVKVMTYTYEKDDELTTKYRAATKKYLDMYSQQIGPYPFEKFALVENFWQTGYGMPSFTLLGNKIIRLPFIIHTSYGHEILHNWWGNSVYVDWESGNWCEGITNYMADHYYKKLAGKDIDYRRSMLQTYLNYVQNERDFPLTEFKERHDPATQAVGYNKSAMVFHMLYQMLGPEKFLAAVQSFYKNYVFKVASWKDIEQEFSKYNDAGDLSWFFKQWITQTGAPTMKIEDFQISEIDNQYNVQLTLSQSSPVYQLLVPIRFEADTDTTVQVMFDQQQQQFSFMLATKPQRVLVDPDFDLFRKLDRAEIPPALSQTFGASAAMMVLPSAVATDLYQAYSQMVNAWGAGQEKVVKNDQEMLANELQQNTTWLFDISNQFVPSFIKSLPPEVALSRNECRINNQAFLLNEHSVILTARHPDNPDLSWTFIHIARVEDFPGIIRKLPHYGQYGYLVFKGAENVAKGEWAITASPLIVDQLTK